jgi:thiosulfate/3-mercaptopyruvate sulfurtransferase
MHELVSTDWLDAERSSADVRVVDVRWYLDPTLSGREAYAAGHIPGAVFLSIDDDLAGPGGRRGGPVGRHPWPSEEQVSRVMSAAGIDQAVHVVAYDDQAGSVAARLWCLLRAHGHERVSVLDGGLVKWLAEGRAMDRSVPAPAPRRFRGTLQPGWIVAKDDLMRPEPGRLVIDVRTPERYRGETEPIDPRAGHIPGAKNLYYGDNLVRGEVPVLQPPEALRQRYLALGADQAEVVAYCGSGVNSCLSLLAMQLAGLRGRVYVGSWSEWSSNPSLPVETGG